MNKIKQGPTLSKQYNILLNRYTEKQTKMKDYMLRYNARNKRGLRVLCRNCDSLVSKDYIGDDNVCPVCGASLFTEVQNKKVEYYKTMLANLQKKLNKEYINCKRNYEASLKKDIRHAETNLKLFKKNKYGQELLKFKHKIHRISGWIWIDFYDNDVCAAMMRQFERSLRNTTYEELENDYSKDLTCIGIRYPDGCGGPAYLDVDLENDLCWFSDIVDYSMMGGDCW